MPPMEKRRFYLRLIIAGACAAASVALVVGLSYLSHKSFEETTVSQAQQQLLIIARTAAERVEDFFRDHTKSLRTAASNPILQKKAFMEQVCINTGSQPCHEYCPIRALYEMETPEGDGITFLDTRGAILCKHPRVTGDLETACPDLWQLAEKSRHGEPCVRGVFYDDLGKASISIAMPVFYQDRLAGLVEWTVILNELYKKFLKPIRVGTQGFVWILDNSQKIIGHPDPKLVGKGLMAASQQAVPDHDWSQLDKILDRCKQGKEGIGLYSCSSDAKRLVAYAPVHVCDELLWSIGVSMDYAQIALPIQKDTINHVQIAALFVILLSVGGFVFYRGEKRKTAELERKNLELEDKALSRRRAEEALKLAHAELNQIFDTAADGMRVISKDFYVLRLNQRFVALSGLTKKEAIGQKCYEVFKGPLCHTPDCALTRIMGGETRVECEVDKERTDGIKIPCFLTATPLATPEGKLVGIVENFKDITESKRSREALRASEAQKQAILDASVDMILHVDAEMRIIWANKTAAAVVNKHPEQLIGHTCHKLFQKSDTPCHGCPCKKAIATGDIEHGIMYQPAMDVVGESYWEDFGVPIKDQSGRVVGVIEIARNVTEKIKAEQKLIQAKVDWEKTFDAIADLVMLLDSEHRIIRVNNATAEALNVSAESLVGKKCYEVIHGESQPVPECPLILTMKTLEPQTREISDSTIGGTFLCSTYPILDHDGKLRGYTHTLKNITESKRLRAQLLHAQKMKSIGTLAGGIAHDFNNLLMSIQGVISLILADIDKTHPHYEWLKTIEDQVASGASLTRQLLGFVKGGEFDLKPTDMNEIAHKTASLFGRTRRELAVNETYEPDLLPVLADRGQMEQVLLNLYLNAWQAMPTGGELYIETSNVILDESYTRAYDLKPGDYVKLSVTDTGTGMEKTIQQRIFDPFFTTKERGWGTGLGLASTFNIIKNHNGIINVYSQQGRGSTFNIYLPAVRTDIPLEEPESSEQSFSKGSETILLVDDEQLILDVGKEMLAALGYEVMAASGAAEALEVFKTHHKDIDLVILDMVMPTMGGEEVYARMREMHPEVRVLLSSGYSVNGKPGQILEKGCDGFIQKPFTMAQLSRSIRNILEKNPTNKSKNGF